MAAFICTVCNSSQIHLKFQKISRQGRKARQEMNGSHTKQEYTFSSLACFALLSPEIVHFYEGFFASGRFASEESNRSINCHPELAKDLPAHRAALWHRSPFSKLTALLGMPSVPKTLEIKVTSVRLREIPSTDSGQALRKLPMNLPVGDSRSAPTARPQCSLGQRPRSLSHNGLGLKAHNRSRSTHCARPTAWDASFAKVLGRCPRLHCGWAVGPEVRQAIPEAIPGSCPTINAALWPPASLRMTAFEAPLLLRRPAGQISLRLRRAKSLARVLKATQNIHHPFILP